MSPRYTKESGDSTPAAANVFELLKGWSAGARAESICVGGVVYERSDENLEGEVVCGRRQRRRASHTNGGVFEETLGTPTLDTMQSILTPHSLRPQHWLPDTGGLCCAAHLRRRQLMAFIESSLQAAAHANPHPEANLVASTLLDTGQWGL